MFKCKRCGKCCRLTPKLSLLEIIKIRLKGHKNFYEKGIRSRYMKMKPNKDCFFLERNIKTACKIYPIRPKMCREYPSTDKSISCKARNKFLRSSPSRRASSSSFCFLIINFSWRLLNLNILFNSFTTYFFYRLNSESQRIYLAQPYIYSWL